MNTTLSVGTRVRLKNMPASYPLATIIEIGEVSIKLRLDETISLMGYQQTEIKTDENSPLHKPRLQREIVIFNAQDIEAV